MFIISLQGKEVYLFGPLVMEVLLMMIVMQMATHLVSIRYLLEPSVDMASPLTMMNSVHLQWQ